MTGVTTRGDRGPSAGDAGPAAAWAPLAAPVLLFGAIDLACRLWLATALELHHLPATRAAALEGAALGALRDLAILLAARALHALWPGRATRALAHAALVACTAIVLGDAVYAHFTLEHVEPVLFVNLDGLAIRGTLRGPGLLGLAAALAGLALLLRLDARCLAAAPPPPAARPRRSAPSPWRRCRSRSCPSRACPTTWRAWRPT